MPSKVEYKIIKALQVLPGGDCCGGVVGFFKALIYGDRRQGVGIASVDEGWTKALS